MRQRRKLVLIGVPLVLASCALHPTAFQVIPRTPPYSLQSPDSRKVPFNEILQNYNGYQPGGRSIGLRSLMQLRIENAYYEKGSSRRGLQGFLGTEVARYEVQSSGLRLLSVQPMNQRPATDLPVQQLIPLRQMNFRYYRLYFEIVFARDNNVHGSVLLGSNSQEELEQLSAALVHPETVCGTTFSHCSVFPDACTVAVEMNVAVNGKTASLIWGSTLSKVVGDHPKRVRLARIYAGKSTPVRIRRLDAEMLALPLLPGDRINWN